MKIMKRSLISLLCVAMLTTLVMSPVVHAEDREPLRVGVAPTSPPIRFWQRNKISGLEADFAEALGKELGRKVEYVDLKFAKLIPSLLSEEIDIIMSGMSVTRIRSLQVAFSDPILRVHLMGIVRAEESQSFLSPFDLVMTNKTVGAKENSTGEFLIVQEFPNAKKRFYPSPEAGAKALKRKQIDVLMLDSPYVQWLAMENEGKLAALPFEFSDDDIAWAVRKTDTDLLEHINIAIAKWKTNGQYDEILNRWLPPPGKSK